MFLADGVRVTGCSLYLDFIVNAGADGNKKLVSTRSGPTSLSAFPNTSVLPVRGIFPLKERYYTTQL